MAKHKEFTRQCFLNFSYKFDIFRDICYHLHKDRRKEQCYETKQTATFVLKEKTGKSDDCVVSNTARGYSDFSVENEGYHFAV